MPNWAYISPICWIW